MRRSPASGARSLIQNYSRLRHTLLPAGMPPAKRASAAAATGTDPPTEGAAKKQKAAKVEKPKEVLPRADTPRRPVPAGRQFKALSWNVAGLRAALKPENIAVLKKLVEDEAPDLLFLQEHKLQEKHVEVVQAELLAALPSFDTAHWAVSTEKAGYSGVVALLHSGSALKPLSVTVGLGGQGFVSEGRALTLRYPNFFVCSVYSPNSGEGLKRLDYRLKEWEPALGAHLRTLDAEAPVLLLGDLNVAHLDSDIWNVGAKHLPKSAGTTPEERAAFSTLLSTNRLVDVFRHFFPTACGCFTYWSQRAGNRPFNRGLRLDYSLASSRLLEATDGLRVSDALLLPSEATLGLSDHGPVGCVLSGV